MLQTRQGIILCLISFFGNSYTQMGTGVYDTSLSQELFTRNNLEGDSYKQILTENKKVISLLQIQTEAKEHLCLVTDSGFHLEMIC